MDNKYKLYTDASRRVDLSGNPLCIIAGVLLDSKDRPIFEFSYKVPENNSSYALEFLAFETGLELASQIKEPKIELVCFMDCLNCVKTINRDMNPYMDKYEDEIKDIQVYHISRKLNTYANALAKLPFNIEYFNSVKLAYHNLNRSKKSFYHRKKLQESSNSYDNFLEINEKANLIVNKKVSLKPQSAKASFR